MPKPSSKEAVNLKESQGEASDPWVTLLEALVEREVSLEDKPWNGSLTAHPRRILEGEFLAIFFLPLTK